jgi:hypothetical protein
VIDGGKPIDVSLPEQLLSYNHLFSLNGKDSV